MVGHLLWNHFFSDAMVPLKRSGYSDMVYADGLYAFNIDNAAINTDLRAAQRSCIPGANELTQFFSDAVVPPETIWLY